jgi:ankyrin repeat protein
LGQEECAKYLIMRGAKLDVRDLMGITPLMHAVSNANFDCIKLLVDNGAHIADKDQFGSTASDIALRKGYHAISAFLEDRLNHPRIPTLGLFEIRLAISRSAAKKIKHIDSLSYQGYTFPIVYPFNNLKGTYLLSLTNSNS